MKRTKFIMLALVVALVLMGAGYAAWTQVFTIQSTVTTGQLKVEVSQSSTVEVLDENGVWEAANALTNSPDFTFTPEVVNPTGQNNTSSLTYTLGGIYPGTKLTSTISFTNVGSIETKTVADYVQSVVTEGYNTPIEDDLIIKVGTTAANLTAINHGTSAADMAKNIADKIVELVPNIPADDVAKSVIITQELPFDTGTDANGHNDTENSTFEWRVVLSFNQYNQAEAD